MCAIQGGNVKVHPLMSNRKASLIAGMSAGVTGLLVLFGDTLPMDQADLVHPADWARDCCY